MMFIIVDEPESDEKYDMWEQENLVNWWLQSLLHLDRSAHLEVDFGV